MMLKWDGVLILLFYLFPSMGITQSQKGETNDLQLFVAEAFQQDFGQANSHKINYLPGHNFYLAKIKPGFRHKPLPGKIIRPLGDDYAIISLIDKSQNSFDYLALLVPANDDWKLSPKLLRQVRKKPVGKALFLIKVNDLPTFRQNLVLNNIPLNTIRKEYEGINSLLIRLNFQTLFEQILPLPSVTFADIRDILPKEEKAVRGLDLSVNKINVIHNDYPEFDGEGLGVSIKENSFDTLDIDLRGRHLASTLRDKAVSTHATTIATMIAGGGNSFYTGKGVAWKAVLSSSSFFNLMPDPDSYFESNDIGAQNHSYGLEVENYYGAEAMAYDDQVYRNPYLLHIFSAGNNGTGTSQEGTYQGISGFANMTGNMKMAKNLFTVGSVDTLLNIPLLSSRGPAFDGRIKPEIVAFGEDGSSGAAAITSGTILLLQQAYKQRFDQLPPAGLIRSLVLNSADDLGPQGPDYHTGYGNLDALGALRTLNDKRFFMGAVREGEEQTFELEIPENAINLKITLAWIDPPALLNSNKALVNDLDILLEDRINNKVWLPWVVSTSPHSDSLNQPAIRKTDRLNNQEQITIGQPNSTNFDIIVSGHDIAEDAQTFFISYEWDTKEQFDWIFPQSKDHVQAAGRIPLRWESSSENHGTLAYRLVGSDEWHQLVTQLDLEQPYLFWEVPDTLALAQLKMTTIEGEFLTDTFVISKPLNLSLALDCEDKILLNWNGIPSAEGYQLFGMGTRYLKQLKTVTDTFIVLDKSTYPSKEFAVSPILAEGGIGVKSQAINLVFQSTGCYINSFLADLIDDRVEMELFLGSLYGVEKVWFEKRLNGKFEEIISFAPSNGLVFETIDFNLREGSNIYRAVVKLQNGTHYYSNEVSILYTSKPFFVFPNPTTIELGASIVSKELNEANFLLFDNLGRLQFRLELQSQYEEIPIEQLAPGIYHYQILSGEEKLSQGKLLIQ